MWANALANGMLLERHYDLDDANNIFNNAVGSCPISTSNAQILGHRLA